VHLIHISILYKCFRWNSI